MAPDPEPTSDEIGERPTEPAAPSHAAVRGGHTPERLGPYRVGETLGWGGMGIVYAAVDERSGDHVAVKLLRFSDPEGVSLRRFQQEVEATRRLNHPHIVGLREVGREGSYDYYAMDLVRGRDLGTWLREERPSPQRAARLIAEVARAVDHAHRRGILHRDLKPANIIVRDDGSPAIADFGLARAIGAESSLTATDQAVGTPQYMSPEQARGRHQDCGPQSDVWSLGVMLYEICTGGRSPFGGETVLDIMQQVVNGEPELPRRLRPEVPVPLERIAMQCLEKRARDRYPSAEALAEDLERYAGGASVLARRYSSWTRALRWTARRWRLAGVAALILGLATATGLLAWSTFGGDGRWVEVFAWDPTVPVDESGMRFTNYQDQELSQPWTVAEGSMVVPYGEWCWLESLRIPGDVRLELTVHTGEVIDGIEMVINSSPVLEGGNRWAWMPIGYGCQFGGYQGSLDFISRNEGRQIANFAYASASRLETRARHELVFQRIGDRFELLVDDEVVNRVVFPMPVVADELDRIGFRTYARDLRVSAIRVSRLGGAAAKDPLALGDAALRLGRPDAAIGEYLATAEAYPEGEHAARALTRAYLVALQRPSFPSARRAAIRERIDERYAGSQALRLVREYEAAQSARNGDWDEVIRRMDAAHDADPDSMVAQRVLELGLRPQDPAMMPRYLEAIGRSRHLRALNLTWAGIEDLSPLRDAPLIWLSMHNNRIADLSPLAGKALRWASLGGNQIADLTPFQGMPLRGLIIDQNRIADLEPLRGAPLDSLNIGGNPFTDIEPIISPGLRSLRIRGSGVTDLAALRGSQLTSLDCSDLEIDSLEDLRGLPLRNLNCSGTAVTSLEPVADLPLERLDASGCPLVGLPPFTGGRLSALVLSACGLTDCEQLAGLELRSLNLSGNELDDLAPLAGQPLGHLDITDNRIVDLSPVVQPQLDSLYCYGNPLEEVGGLPELEIEPLLLGDGRHPLGDAAIERLVAAWRDDPLYARHAIGLQALRSWREDLEQARLWARQVAGIEAVFVPRWLPYAQARVLAASAGGRLADVHEIQVVAPELVPPRHDVWIEGGIVAPTGRAPVWIEGEAREGQADPRQRRPLLVVWDRSAAK